MRAFCFASTRVARSVNRGMRSQWLVGVDVILQLTRLKRIDYRPSRFCDRAILLRPATKAISVDIS
ncbi:hypothetical protein RBSWK_04795 [Rhodopirellula baltica SWK14]|uniref:Uncharacterized protein n=1 Tax=Rhodopirellula baltica SWK14 TaxID=993516 RepID=L7CBV2_RHOBT|nr:hypothetical protein RBSWK_04795 [Rhodopirellula baltica SWK14]